MAVYFANPSLTTDQNPHWSLGMPSLPAPDYDRYLGGLAVGLGIASTDPAFTSPSPQVQLSDVSSSELSNFDIPKELWCPSNAQHGYGMNGYAPLLPGRSQEMLYPAAGGSLAQEPAARPDSRRTSFDSTEGAFQLPLRLPVGNCSNNPPPPDGSLKPKPTSRRRSSQHSVNRPRRRSSYSDHKEDNPDVWMMRKKAHNQVEKRYRANLNAGFKQLEDVTKLEPVSAATDQKMAKGLRPGRKALILQNAYEHILGLQAELKALQQQLGNN
ncbi:hypothetical protein BDV25DRAFT_138871 [Aspergillus avenaceus]|uniref:BHLH domain-containing protein n=1 Tax=Aspergillus avenaceus TaxID=36643 RepID=A0A5N6TZG0_ASPAV|nr:hypothetical protein BDV25DRAFT_138871 [Aspergillus avenaceus]